MFTVTVQDGSEAHLEPRSLAGADVVCCRALVRPEGESGGRIRRVLEGLGLTCSCFVPDQKFSKTGGEPAGLAILTGPGLWPLNSGRLRPSGEDRDLGAIVQFLHVRKQSASLLVFNLRFALEPERQHAFLGAVFAHPLFKERYSGVVLCSDRPVEVGERVLRGLARASGYALCPTGADSGPLLFVPAPGRGTTARVSPIGPADLPVAERNRTLRLSVQQHPARPSDRLRVPLSYREQWLGSQECFRAYAL